MITEACRCTGVDAHSRPCRTQHLKSLLALVYDRSDRSGRRNRIDVVVVERGHVIAKVGAAVADGLVTAANHWFLVDGVAFAGAGVTGSDRIQRDEICALLADALDHLLYPLGRRLDVVRRFHVPHQVRLVLVGLFAVLYRTGEGSLFRVA